MVEMTARDQKVDGGESLIDASVGDVHLPTMFRGRSDYSIDDKGRLTLPPQMRKALGDVGNLAVLDGRAVLWSEATYRRAVDELNRRVAERELELSMVRGFLANTHQVSPDAQGRIVVPHAVRIEAALEREVTVLGAGPRIEIVPAGTDALSTAIGIADEVANALDQANF